MKIAISIPGKDFIKRHEGLSQKVYKDAGGLPTIGYGHLLKSDDAKNLGLGIIGMKAISDWFDADVAAAAVGVDRQFYSHFYSLLAWQEAQTTIDALISFVFNLGEPAVASGKFTLARWRAGDKDGFCASLAKWDKVKIDNVLTPNAGLAKRRAAEVKLIKSGSYK